MCKQGVTREVTRAVRHQIRGDAMDAETNFSFDLPYVSQVPRLQLGLEDAAAALGLPVSTLELECRRGRGPKFFKVGHRLFTT